ncbi:alkaline phosphatase family protein [Candidatus Woesearchaeota archaeon]|nr:alkaline phosphatase family protein [Candidatus Woesearchaeota archaeon]
MGRIVLLGIDSATWTMIKPLLKEDCLPNFKRLMQTGSYGNLKPLKGYKSPALWNSVATGKVPRKHGIEFFCNTKLKLGKKSFNLSDNFFTKAYSGLFGLFYRKENYHAFSFPRRAQYWATVKLGNLLKKIGLGDNHLLTSNDRKVQALWNIFSDNGKKAGMVGWWNSWPAESVNGFIVSEKSNSFLSAMLSKSTHYRMYDKNERLVFPSSISGQTKDFVKNYATKDIIASFFGDLSETEKNALANTEYVPRNRVSLFKYYFNTDCFYFSFGKHLFKEFNPDLYCIYLPGLDPLQHVFWQYNHIDDFKFAGISESEIQKFCKVIPEYYKMTDRRLGEMLDLLNEDDVIIVMSDHGMESVPKRKYSDKFIRSGQHDHSPDGIFLIAGRNIKQGFDMGDVDVINIAPTILFLAGLPLAEDMDGTILENCLENVPNFTKIKSYETAGKKTIGTAYTQEEEEKIKQRLSDLGYL